MKLLRKIMLTTDFGQGADCAVRTAIGLAKAFKSEIVPIHVLPESLPDEVDKEVVMKAVRARLRELSKNLDGDGVVSSEPIVVSGPPAVIIAEQAEMQGADVIVLGASLNADKRGDKIGTTTGRLLRESRKPVWVVPPGGGNLPTNIVCAVEPSDESDRVLRNGVLLARALDAQLTILTVVRPLGNLLSYLDADYAKEKDQNALKNARQRLEKNLSSKNLDGLDWKSEVLLGEPDEEISGYAKKNDIDLILLGASGKSMARKLILGSVADKVIRRLPCAILVVSDEKLLKIRVEAEVEDMTRHFEDGQKLLEKGLAEEAEAVFERCVATSPFHVPAWEKLAEARSRLGDESGAAYAREKAKEIFDQMWKQRVESEVRRTRGIK